MMIFSYGMLFLKVIGLTTNKVCYQKFEEGVHTCIIFLFAAFSFHFFNSFKSSKSFVIKDNPNLHVIIPAEIIVKYTQMIVMSVK